MRLDIVPGARISQVTDLLYPVSDINMETYGIIVDISKDCLAVCSEKLTDLLVLQLISHKITHFC